MIEGTDAYAEFSVELSAASAGDVDLTLALASGTAQNGGIDFGSSTTGNIEYSTDAGVTWTFGTSVTIVAGSTSVLVRTPIVDDAVSEPTEDFSLNVTVASGSTANSTATSVVTLIDDDVVPTLSVADLTVVEGVDAHAVFTVELSAASAGDVTVDLALASGTAQNGGIDFGANGAPNIEVSTDAGVTWTFGTSVTIVAGSTDVLVRTPIIDDAEVEPTEDFSLNVTVSSGTTANSTATSLVTLEDNDVSSTLLLADLTVVEGVDAYAEFSVELSPVSTEDVAIDLVLTNGTALNGGVDFGSATSGDIEYSTDAGVTWAFGSIVTIVAGSAGILVRTPIVDDPESEPTEDFTLKATVTAGSTTNTDATSLVTLEDNDAPDISLSDLIVKEGVDGFAEFTITLSNASFEDVVADLVLSDGLATGGGVDYGTAGAGNLEVSNDGGATWADATSVTFVAGVTNVLVRTPVVDDVDSEPVEDFLLDVIVTAGATGNLNATSLVTLGDNDTPSLLVDDVVVAEGVDGYAEFSINLSNPGFEDIVADLLLSDGSAAGSGVDYGAVGAGDLEVSTDAGATWADATSIIFVAGATNVLARTPVVDDVESEPTEEFALTIAVTAGSTINADATSLVTLEDNDAPTISIADLDVTEGVDGFAEFTIALDAASFEDITVDLSLTDGVASGAGVDYGSSGVGNIEVSVDGGATWSDGTSVTIAAGATIALARTPIVDDSDSEPSEDFALTAVVASGATTNASASSKVTILDDDEPELVVGNASVVEGVDAYAFFRIELTSPSYETISADLEFLDVTAIGGGVDYGSSGPDNLEISTDNGVTWSAATELVFLPGETTAAVRTPVVDDLTGEPTEEFSLSATVTAGVTTNASALATGTITDNDPATLSIGDVAVEEGSDPYAVFPVSLSIAAVDDVVVDLALVDGTATGGGVDFGSAGISNIEVSVDGGVTWVDSSTFTLVSGNTDALVRTAIIDDSESEPLEEFVLSATVSGGTTSNSAVDAVATIGESDAPTVNVSSVTVGEADSFAVFAVDLSHLTFEDITADLLLLDGTATGAGVDFGAADSTNLQVSTDGGTTWSDAMSVTVVAGTTGALVRTPVVNDALSEAVEHFSLDVAVSAGMTTNASANGGARIADDDLAELTVSDSNVEEGVDGHAEFTLTLSIPVFEDVTADLGLADGTALGSGVDFGTAGAGNLEVSTDGGATWSDASSVTIPAGSVTALARTPIVDDGESEPSEDFAFTATVTAGTTSNVSSDAVATISDNDAPTVTVGDIFVEEGTHAVFTISLSNASYQDVSFDLALTDGSAEGGGVDYGTSGTANLEVSQDDGLTWIDSTSLTIVSGSLDALVRTPVVSDGVAEGTEDFTLSVTVTMGDTANAGDDAVAQISDPMSLVFGADDEKGEGQDAELIDRVFSDWL